MNTPQSDPSRTSKWILLVSSLMTLGFLLAAAVRENVTAQWRGVQNQYPGILESKAADEKSRQTARAFPVEIRQVSIPALKAVDRCVTCHLGIDDPRMKDQAQPYRTHSRNLLSAHRVEKFGCTVCHQGQGAALSFEEAKAEEHYWDYPLLPRAMTEASCNSCHDPRALPKGTAVRLVRGMELYDEKGCSSCHKLEGKGGTLGPALDNVGLKTKHQFSRVNLKGSQTVWNWLSQHFRDPRGIVPSSRMPNPGLSQAGNEALTVYMLSLRQLGLPEEYMAPDKIEQKYGKLHPPPPDGKALYARYCAACHDNGLYTRWDKSFQRFVPGIRQAALLRTVDDQTLEENVREGRPGTFMPGWGKTAGGLSDAEIEALVHHLRGETQPVPLTPAPSRGDLKRGGVLFARNCAGCHGVDGKGLIAPSLANPVFQKTASDAFLADTILKGREYTPMPAFGRSGMGAADIGDLIAHLRSFR